jgi:pilus assembly protein Flp/PilA
MNILTSINVLESMFSVMRVKSTSHAIAFLRDERAATAIEYGLIVTGIALGTLAVLSGVGANLTAAFLLLKDAV